MSRIRRRFSMLAAVAALYFVLSAGASTPDYTFTTIDVGMNTDTEIWGLNNNGLATGFTYDANGTGHGIVVQNGVVTVVDAPGAGVGGTNFYQVNSYASVAGSYFDASGDGHSFVYNIATKVFTALPNIVGFPYNFAGGLNNSFEVAGNVTTDPTFSSNLIAWIYSKRAYQFFVDPLSSQAMYGTVTYALNDAGTLVGVYIGADGTIHGFSTPGSQGPFTQIDYPGALNTETYGVNNPGTISGRYRVGDVRHGFILSSSGKYTSIDVPNAASTWITSINDHGDLGGYFEDASGNYHGFLAKKK